MTAAVFSEHALSTVLGAIFPSVAFSNVIVMFKSESTVLRTAMYSGCNVSATRTSLLRVEFVARSVASATAVAPS